MSRSSGTGGSRTPDNGLYQGKVTEVTAEVVADGDSGREPVFLDRELLSGEAAYTHTHTGRSSINGTERKSSQLGYGVSEPTRTNYAPRHSSPTDGEQRFKDKKTLKREIRERIADSVDVDAQVAPHFTAEDFFRYWLWRCRATQLDWSVHPLRKFNPTATVFLGEDLTHPQFNPSPRVADYESAEDVMELFLGPKD